jgi:hypothetical protein
MFPLLFSSSVFFDITPAGGPSKRVPRVWRALFSQVQTRSPVNPYENAPILENPTDGFPGIINIVGFVCGIPGKPEVTKAGDSRFLCGFPCYWTCG